ncbi:MAG: hypothetical protein HY908_02700 [Myxococcales bacterium]|nr:hypothetical protein [Myxococcales bacterium]
MCSRVSASRRVSIPSRTSGRTRTITYQDHIGASSDQGSVYAFSRTVSLWAEQQKLVASDGAAQDYFGRAVSLSADGSRALLGADPHDVGANDQQGSAYVFALVSKDSNGTPCSTGDTCASGHCVEGVCCDRDCGAGAPADCQACTVAAGAKTDGTCAPLAAGVACRTEAGICDVGESCDGSSVDCPTDAALPVGTACGGAPSGVCDAQDTCTGTVGATATCTAGTCRRGPTAAPSSACAMSGRAARARARAALRTLPCPWARRAAAPRAASATRRTPARAPSGRPRPAPPTCGQPARAAASPSVSATSRSSATARPPAAQGMPRNRSARPAVAPRAAHAMRRTRAAAESSRVWVALLCGLGLAGALRWGAGRLAKRRAMPCPARLSRPRARVTARAGVVALGGGPTSSD